MVKAFSGALDAVLHQPVRSQLAAYLSGRGEASFAEIKRALSLTDGNLDSHLRKLVEANYVVSRRETAGGRTQTVYTLTAQGLSAMHEYLAQLHHLISMAEGTSTSIPEADPSADPVRG